MSAAGNNIDGGLCLVSDAPQVRQLLLLLLLLLLLPSAAAAMAVRWLRMYSVSHFHSSTAQGLGTLQCRVWGAGESSLLNPSHHESSCLHLDAYT